MNHLTLAIVARTLFSADVSEEADEIRAAPDRRCFSLFEMVLLAVLRVVSKNCRFHPSAGFEPRARHAWTKPSTV